MTEKIVFVFQDTCIFAARKHSQHVWRLDRVYDKKIMEKHKNLDLELLKL